MTTAQIVALIAAGDVSPFYNDRAWRRLAREVRREQHNECQYCRQKGRYRRARYVHHVMRLREHPELAYCRFYLDSQGQAHRNLVACCFDCHEAQHPERFAQKPKPQLNQERW